MSHTLRVALTGAAVSCLLAASAATARAQQAPPLVIRGAHVVPMDRERVLHDRTVVIRGGRIAEIGPSGSTTVPAGAEVVDAEGRYLIPGLVDMHVHVEAGTGAPGDAAWRQMALLVANGVTTARSLYGPPSGLALRSAISEGGILAPRLLLAGPSINYESTPTPASARASVRRQAELGFEFIKTHGVTRDVYDAMVDAVRGTSLRLVGHVVPDYGLEAALAAGQQIEHLDGYLAAAIAPDAPVRRPGDQLFFGEELEYVRQARLAALARQTVQAGVWNSPTLALFELAALPQPAEAYRTWPETRFVPDSVLLDWERQLEALADMAGTRQRRTMYLELRKAAVRVLRDAGAGLLAGSDSPQLFMVSGFALHRELRALQEAGLTPFEALATATVNPARYLFDDTFGVIAPGRRADLVLLERNPLDDVSNAARISGVVLRGRWLSASALAELENEVERAVELPPSGRADTTP